MLVKDRSVFRKYRKNNIDSFDRVAWEAHVLKRISNKNYTTNYIDSFVVGNEFFLLEKFIEGDNLGQAIIDNLIKDEESNICSKIFQIVKELHLLGYRMVDLSLNNFMWNQQDLYIIDLEYFYHESSDYYLIENYNQGTIGFVFPELQLPPLLFDLYALYKMIFYINNRQEYIEFVEKVKEIPMNEYNDSFINEMESKVKDKLFEYYSVDIQTDMNKLSYKEHLIFIENFLTNLKKEAMQ